MSKKRFSDEANMHYRYPNSDMLLNNTDALLKMIIHHRDEQVPRLKTLEEYYLSNNTTILEEGRRKEEHHADHRASHPFAAFISNFIKGYMMGKPLKTTYPENDDIEQFIQDINILNDADAHNSELALNQSIFGRAYELLYRTDDTHFVEIDPKETFVIYDDTVESNPIAAVRYLKSVVDDNLINVYFYTDKKVYHFQAKETFDKLTLVKETEHFFGGVPIIEYENNKYRQGDFEKVLNLIDLYDSAQSDTANYMTDLNDAMLKIVGSVELDVEEAQKQKEANIILLKPDLLENGNQGNVDADYIYKKYDVAGTEAYKDRIFNDILMFTNTPNLLDSNFSGTQSGEAMKYKLFGLEQDRASKERSFKRSLRERYRLINNVSSFASEGEFDVSKIEITFMQNLPKDIKNEMDWFVRAGGELSNETMLSQLTFIENVKDEIEKIEEEKPQRKAISEMYNFPEGDIDEDERREKLEGMEGNEETERK